MTRSLRPGLCVFALAAVGCSDAGPESALVIETPGPTELMVGELLALSVTSSGDAGPVSWSSSAPEVADVVGGTVEALRPGSAVITASAPDALPDGITLTVVARPDGYTAEEVDYFTEIAFGSEFGGATPLLRRWRDGSGPLIRINGSPTAADLEVVDGVVAEINRLVPVDIELVADFPTVEMHFVAQSQFDDILPQAPGGNNGLVWVWWGADQYLFQSVVLIATDISASLRAHIIREELTQMLGLLQDSFRYSESIFYQGFSDVTEYLVVDQAVIELLYRPELDVGMTAAAAARVARQLTRVGAEPVAPGANGAGARAGGAHSTGRPPGSLGFSTSLTTRAIGRPGSGGSGGRLISSRSPPRPAPPGGSR